MPSTIDILAVIFRFDIVIKTACFTNHGIHGEAISDKRFTTINAFDLTVYRFPQ